MIQKDTSFLQGNFFLETTYAERLYHEYAAALPIIDYHNHLSPEKIASESPFESITEAWLAEDHYKWRAMRMNGVAEAYITGSASAKEKFQKWAETVPYTLGNPLFHWTHLELQRYFQITDILQPETAEVIFEKTKEKLQQTTALQLLQEQNVEILCTTDDPADTLEYHKKLTNQRGIKVLPTFRSDRAVAIDAPDYKKYLQKLSAVSQIEILDFTSLLDSIAQRIQFFDDTGCLLSDYGLSGPLLFTEVNDTQANAILQKRMSGETLDTKEISVYRSTILYHLGCLYHKYGWVQQYHLGALRNTSTRRTKQFGADAGCDSVGDFSYATSLSLFLDALDQTNQLPKTIVYNLNPSQNEVFATMMGNFASEEYPGKMQWGAAWWFQDQKNGIENHLNILSNMNLLSRFIGMLTDSRSFLSFPRHEYFRRTLCNYLGNQINRGLLPNDLNFLGKTVQNICYYNVKQYLSLH